MFTKPIHFKLMLLAGIFVASGVRAQRDVLMDVVSPVAAAVVAPVAPVVATVAPAPKGYEVKRGTDGLFYVQAIVNGRPVRFLVDTGASVVVLTEADARAVGVVLEDRHYRQSVDTVGGSMPMAWATLESVHLAGHDIRGVRAAVVRSGLGVSLMGQNMLAELHSVTLTADRLNLR